MAILIHFAHSRVTEYTQTGITYSKSLWKFRYSTDLHSLLIIHICLITCILIASRIIHFCSLSKYRCPFSQFQVVIFYWNWFDRKLNFNFDSIPCEIEFNWCGTEMNSKQFGIDLKLIEKWLKNNWQSILGRFIQLYNINGCTWYLYVIAFDILMGGIPTHKWFESGKQC